MYSTVPPIGPESVLLERLETKCCLMKHERAPGLSLCEYKDRFARLSCAHAVGNGRKEILRAMILELQRLDLVKDDRLVELDHEVRTIAQSMLNLDQKAWKEIELQELREKHLIIIAEKDRIRHALIEIIEEFLA
jgi:hypothetical protein